MGAVAGFYSGRAAVLARLIFIPIWGYPSATSIGNGTVAVQGPNCAASARDVRMSVHQPAQQPYSAPGQSVRLSADPGPATLVSSSPVMSFVYTAHGDSTTFGFHFVGTPVAESHTHPWICKSSQAATFYSLLTCSIYTKRAYPNLPSM